MTTDIFHIGGGCEAIVRTKGNELITPEVHFYLCKNKPIYIVRLPGNIIKKA